VDVCGEPRTAILGQGFAMSRVGTRQEPATVDPIVFQGGLFEAGEVAFDAAYRGVRRIALDGASWVDHAQGWVRGADALFQVVIERRKWQQRTRRIYDQQVLEPRLTAPWSLESGEVLEPAIVEAMRASLSERYGVRFDSVGFNLYRNGEDSVAWHRDRISREIEDPTIAIVSLGERRKLLLRPWGGGRSKAFQLGHGDLLVTGGRTNADWEHSVPKVARAGPRISLAFRHGLDPRAYGEQAGEPT
jgi:alkylated DNA repair dioxygenase AlkB